MKKALVSLFAIICLALLRANVQMIDSNFLMEKRTIIMVIATFLMKVMQVCAVRKTGVMMVLQKASVLQQVHKMMIKQKFVVLLTELVSGDPSLEQFNNMGDKI